MTDIPPGRYRIVERKGRIIVTDTWAEGGRPGMPAALAPVGETRPSPSAPSRSPPSATRADGNVGLLWLRRRLVALACLGATDAAGRSILTTHAHLDEKGPRSIVLNEVGAARLGNGLLAVLAATLALVIGSGFSPLIILLAAGVAGLTFTSASSAARPAITRWLDELGDTTRR